MAAALEIARLLFRVAIISNANRLAAARPSLGHAIRSEFNDECQISRAATELPQSNPSQGCPLTLAIFARFSVTVSDLTNFSTEQACLKQSNSDK